MPTYPPTPAIIPPVAGAPPTAPPVGAPPTAPPVGAPPATDPPVGAPPATDPPAPVPTPPSGGLVAVDDATTMVSSDGIAFISVLENDTPGQFLSVKNAEGGSNGSCDISIDLTQVVYQPNAGFVGMDSCEYEACDDQTPPNCLTATVTINVT